MNWWSLRAAGSLYVLKVSYLVLLVVPLLSAHQALIDALGVPHWFAATLFLASLSLALANLVFDIWCPTIVKRFASPNDLYERMLQIRRLSFWLYPDDLFDASLEHCKAAYNAESKSLCFARWACTILFFISAAAFLVVFAYRTWLVFQLAFAPLVGG